eukprot:scaffold3871_cov97-Isochrysis_galbana.AAC.7
MDLVPNWRGDRCHGADARDGSRRRNWMQRACLPRLHTPPHTKPTEGLTCWYRSHARLFAAGGRGVSRANILSNKATTSAATPSAVPPFSAAAPASPSASISIWRAARPACRAWSISISNASAASQHGSPRLRPPRPPLGRCDVSRQHSERVAAQPLGAGGQSGGCGGQVACAALQVGGGEDGLEGRGRQRDGGRGQAARLGEVCGGGGEGVGYRRSSGGSVLTGYSRCRAPPPPPEPPAFDARLGAAQLHARITPTISNAACASMSWKRESNKRYKQTHSRAPPQTPHAPGWSARRSRRTAPSPCAAPPVPPPPTRPPPKRPRTLATPTARPRTAAAPFHTPRSTAPLYGSRQTPLLPKHHTMDHPTRRRPPHRPDRRPPRRRSASRRRPPAPPSPAPPPPLPPRAGRRQGYLRAQGSSSARRHFRRQSYLGATRYSCAMRGCGPTRPGRRGRRDECGRSAGVPQIPGRADTGGGEGSTSSVIGARNKPERHRGPEIGRSRTKFSPEGGKQL